VRSEDKSSERFVQEGLANKEEFQRHIGRYVFASHYIEDKTVLDAASGAGYGSCYLAKLGAAHVIGSDISFDAIDYASKRYQRERLHFVLADATKMPFRDDSFDFIVSFETIEHIEQPETFLSECARVLRKEGSFICSTPNKRVSAAYHYDNPYHENEFYPAEFFGLLSKYFDGIHCFSQENRTFLGLKANELFRDIFKPSPGSKPGSGEILKRGLWKMISVVYYKFEALDTKPRKNNTRQVDITDETDFADLLSNDFKVISFRDNLYITPTYLLALCEKPKKDVSC
jgi:SAM-dependent methyltransferase